jgi:hypothetical protein
MNGYPTVALSAGSKRSSQNRPKAQQTIIRKPLICLPGDTQSLRTVPVVGLSLGPATRKPVVVGFSDIFVDIAAKLFHTIGVGTNIELAFINEKDRWIAIIHFAFAHVISAEASILRNISGRILAKRDFVGLGNEIEDRTPEPGLNCRVAFDGLVTGKVGNWVVSLQNYTAAVNVHPGLRGGLGGFFGQDDDPIVFCDFTRIPGQAGRVEDNGNRNCYDETRKKRDRLRFHSSIVLLSGLDHKPAEETLFILFA